MSKDKKNKDEYAKSVVKMLRGMNDMVKTKPNDQGYYEVKNSQPHKKKTMRQIEAMCFHWRLDKNDVPQPAIDDLAGKPGMARCRICKAEFPWIMRTIDPNFPETTPYAKEIDDFVAAVNTTVFYATKFSSGKSEDFGVFAALRKGAKEFRKISYAVSYAFTKQKQFADQSNRATSDFNAYNYTGLRFTP